MRTLAEQWASEMTFVLLLAWYHVNLHDIYQILDFVLIGFLFLKIGVRWVKLLVYFLVDGVPQLVFMLHLLVIEGICILNFKLFYGAKFLAEQEITRIVSLSEEDIRSDEDLLFSDDNDKGIFQRRI